MFPCEVWFSKILSSCIYSINSCVIQNDNQHKDLGIIVSSGLSWTNHIIYIAAKAFTKFLPYPYRNNKVVTRLWQPWDKLVVDGCDNLVTRL